MRLRRASPKISERERSRTTLHCGTFDCAKATTWPDSPPSPVVGVALRTKMPARLMSVARARLTRDPIAAMTTRHRSPVTISPQR
jgi:hypothetical protein